MHRRRHLATVGAAFHIGVADVVDRRARPDGFLRVARRCVGCCSWYFFVVLVRMDQDRDCAARTVHSHSCERGPTLPPAGQTGS
jgi:hypothetical protein